MNGLFWGVIISSIAFSLFGKYKLGLLILPAITLNLLLAAIMGVMIILLMTKAGCDPEVGSSVLITAETDRGGFFYFLG